MKINNFRGDLPDFSAKKEALVRSFSFVGAFPCGVFVLADRLARSPQKLLIFIKKKSIFVGSQYPKNLLFTFENEIIAPSSVTFLSTRTTGLVWCTVPTLYHVPVRAVRRVVLIRLCEG